MLQVLLPSLISGAGVGASLIKSRRLPQEKRAASIVANEIERQMQENLRRWESSNKTILDQEQALLTFDQLWADFVNEMATLGSPGQQAIMDRQREPSSGDRLPGVDWFSLYRDPIANYHPTTPITSQQGAGWSTIGAFGLIALGALMYARE